MAFRWSIQRDFQQLYLPTGSSAVHLPPHPSSVHHRRAYPGSAPSFWKARHRLLIVSPFISIHAIENDQLVPLIRHTVQRGVDVTVYTDSSLDYDTKTNQLLSRAEEGRNILIENGATLIEVKGIHNKSLAIDNHTLIEGSFNWLSANRHKEYSRHECSIVVSSVQADEYINNLIKELESREKPFNPYLSLQSILTLTKISGVLYKRIF